MTGPAGLGAVPDALGKLLPQGLEARQPGRAHPVESSDETSCQNARNLVGDGNQPMERGRRKTEPKGVKQLGRGALMAEAQAVQHSQDKQLYGQSRGKQMEW